MDTSHDKGLQLPVPSFCCHPFSEEITSTPLPQRSETEHLSSTQQLMFLFDPTECRDKCQRK